MRLRMRLVLVATVLAAILTLAAQSMSGNAEVQSPPPSGGEAPADMPPVKFGTNIGHWLSQSKLDRAVMATLLHSP